MVSDQPQALVPGQRRSSAHSSAHSLAHWEPLLALVLDGLSSPHSRLAYQGALREFFAWYEADGAAGFSKATVQRYRSQLEARGLAPSSINLRLAALKKLAAEAADNRLLEPETAAAIARVRGAKRQGVRAGNWLLKPQAGNRHLLALSLGQGGGGQGGAHAFGHQAGAGLGEAQPPPQPLAHPAIAGERAGAREHQVAEAGQPGQGLRAPPEGSGQAADLGEPSGDEGGHGVVTIAQAVHDASGDGDHVLESARQLDPDDVFARVHAERAGGEHPLDALLCCHLLEAKECMVIGCMKP